MSTQRDHSPGAADSTVPVAGGGVTPDRTGPYLGGDAASPPPTGQAGRHRLLGEIGRGGMGVVLRGHDPDLDRDLAVKVLLDRHQDNAEAARRFLEEARIGGRLQHPGVVPVYEVGRCDDRRPYFTMKLVEGRTLAALLGERGGPEQDLPRFLQVFEQVCQTVGYAHARGVIHRDLKPSNIMVGAFGEVQVMDWGLAKVLKSAGAETRADAGDTVRVEPDDGESRAGSVLGTPAYMAPEQARGEIDRLDARCDVFGLGAILCEILTAAPPYRGRETIEVLRLAENAALADARERLERCGADAELVGLATACLAAQPGDRPADGGAVAAAMTAYLTGVQERLRGAEVARAAAEARADEARAKAAAERRARRLTAALAAAVLGIVLVGGGAWLWVTQERAARLADAARVEGEKAERRAATTRAVEAALHEAAGLREQARAAGPDGLAKWTDALAAAKRAEGLLAGGEVDEELRQQVAALLGELEAEARDRRMLARLDDARLQFAAIAPNGHFDRDAAAAAFARAFHDDGLDVLELEPQEAVDRIHRRAIEADLLAAVADWAATTTDASRRKRLFAVVHAADPDPGSFRNRWHTAVENRDRAALVRLAAEPDVADLLPTRLEYLGKGLSSVGAEKEAAALLRTAQRRHPGDFWLNLDLGVLLSRMRPPQREDALRFCTAAAALRPSSAGARNNLGIVYHDMSRFDEAAAEYRAALALQPDYARAHSNLGAALQAKGGFDDAVDEFHQALALQPDLADAHNNLAVSFLGANRLGEAEAELRKAIELQSDFYEAHNNLGAVLHRRGHVEEALAEYHAALLCRNDDAVAHNVYGCFLQTNARPKEAEAEFRWAIELQSDYADAHNNLGVTLQDQGRSMEAEAAFRKAVQFRPRDAKAHKQLGFLLRDRGRLEDAALEFRRAVDLAPDADPDLYNALGMLLRALGRLDEATSEYGKATELRPEFAAAHNNLGNVLRALGRVDEAVAEFQKAAALKPRIAMIHNNLAGALQDLGKGEDAVAEFQKAVDLQPEETVFHGNLGLALRLQGRFAESLRAMRRAQDLGSKDPHWPDPSGRQVRQAEETVERAAVLPAVLKGQAEPADAGERLGFSRVCGYKRLYAAAARFAEQAFAEQRGLEEDLSDGARYAAACDAARAGCGEGEDAARLAEPERTRLRRRALEWLRADLDQRVRRLEAGDPLLRSETRQTLHLWRATLALSGVRDATGLSKLPPAEQDAWRRLWADVDAVVGR